MPDQLTSDRITSQVGLLDQLAVGVGILISDSVSFTDNNVINSSGFLALSDTLSFSDSTALRTNFLVSLVDLINLSDFIDVDIILITYKFPIHIFKRSLAGVIE